LLDSAGITALSRLRRHDEQAQVSHLDLAGWFGPRPEQNEGNPRSEGRKRLHDWVAALAIFRGAHGAQGGEVNASMSVFEETLENTGAWMRGRNMFGPMGGGSWGDNSPYQHGRHVTQQYLAAGLLDELGLHVVPVSLGEGPHLLDNHEGVNARLERVGAVEAFGIAYLKCRILRGASS